MVRCASISLVAAAASCLAVQSSGESGIRVAEVKPHYGCRNPEGQQRVREHIEGLLDERYGLVALLQVEFPLAQREGYMAFGASCTTHYADPAVVLVDEAQFSLVSVIGETAAGNFSAMPFLADGTQPGFGGNMCMADPEDVYPPAGVLGSGAQSSARYPGGKVGSRPYAGAVLQHKVSGKDVCVLTGTFPHCMWQWQKTCTESIADACGDRQIIVIADTNAGCEQSGPENSHEYTMQRIAEEQGVDWGSCSDPSIEGPPTCCNDISWNVTYPRYWYDRTAICRGGRVEDFEVLPGWVCQDSDAEHRFTTAHIYLDDMATVV